MKWARFIKYAVSMLAVIVLVAGTVYFPKIYNYKRDSKDFNKVHTYKQDEISLYVKNDASVGERLKMLGSILSNEIDWYYVVLKEEYFDEEFVISRTLEEINRMTECGLIPDLSAYDLRGSYAIQCKGIAGSDYEEDFKYWSIEFTDFKESYNFRFLVDYETYMIYFADLESDLITEWDDMKYYRYEDNSIFGKFSTACMEYYLPDEIRSYVIDDSYSSIFNSFELVYDKNSLFFTSIIEPKEVRWLMGIYDLFILDESMDYRTDVSSNDG